MPFDFDNEKKEIEAQAYDCCGCHGNLELKQTNAISSKWRNSASNSRKKDYQSCTDMYDYQSQQIVVLDYLV